jgi:hypothetical protein
MTAGGSLCPASLAGAADKFLVQEGHGDEVLLLVRSDSLEVAHQRQTTTGEAVAGVV